MEITLKAFDNTDWELYPGCEGEPEIAFINLPLEGTVMECVVVVDDNGINLDYEDMRDPDNIVCHDFQYPMDGQGLQTAKEKLATLNLYASTITVNALVALGFIYNKV